MSVPVGVGCPVYRREWIIGRWFDHVQAAFEVAGVEPEFFFVVDPEDPTARILNERSQSAGPLNLIYTEEDHARGDDRQWNWLRYQRMADLRNLLLGAVRQRGPMYFLSLDSDVLLHRDALKRMMDLINGWDAIGSRCYMVPAYPSCPSYAKLSSYGGLYRPDSHGTFEVDVIMAIKLMSPSVYDVDYVPHRLGEDIGFCTAARERGLKFGWDGGVCSKHVMRPVYLDRIDPRCDY